MPSQQLQPVSKYLEDAVAAEDGFESTLRRFAVEGDDEDTQAILFAHAEVTHRQRTRLADRLVALGGKPSGPKGLMAHLLNLAPRVPQVGHSAQERTVQNLVTAFGIECFECAFYESLISVARAAGDWETEELARGIQREERETADSLFKLLPSRSKIAFNMLTLDEIDLAIETKAAANRIV